MEDLKKMFVETTNKEIKIDPKTIQHRIGNFKIAKPVKAKLTPEDKFKGLMIKGLEKQLQYIQADIEGFFSSAIIKRWYKSTEDKKGFYCFLKFQNKPIPYLEEGATALIANNLNEVKTIYQNLKQEIESNFEFVKYLFELTKTMSIATRGGKR